MITQFAFNALLKAIGVAEVFVGDPFTVGGMLPLGATEGEIRGEISYSNNNLTAPERTGGIPHQSQVNLDTANIIVPLIIGDPDLWEKIMPTGEKGGGYSSFQQPEYTTVLVVPRSEMSAGGTLGYAGGPPKVWTPAAPQNALWLWRAFPTPGNIPYRFADGGKVISEVRFTGMFDAARPEGHKVFTIGDPVPAGITTLAI